MDRSPIAYPRDVPTARYGLSHCPPRPMIDDGDERCIRAHKSKCVPSRHAGRARKLIPSQVPARGEVAPLAHQQQDAEKKGPQGKGPVTATISAMHGVESWERLRESN